ncbi:MAG: mRNA splicing protein prp18 [Cirrosporium novae-zelandiae]|nr:MAG: mRNA splicing protein prp18 [Cirrosporium novae-zelandiae]
MDFASLMKQQMSKAKKPLTSNSKSKSPEASTAPKYQSRAEIEAAREAAYRAEQAALEAERVARRIQKRKVEEQEAEHSQQREEKRQRLAEESRIKREQEEKEKETRRRKRLGLPPLEEVNKDEEKNQENQEDGEEMQLDEETVVKSLRAIGEPTRLFAETDNARLKRYKRLLASRGLSSTDGVVVTMTKGPIPTTLVLVPESEMKVPSTVPKSGPERTYIFRQLASYFTLVLTEWQRALAQRDADVRQSFQGKAAEKAMLQSQENLKPLFRKFEKGDLEDGILEPVVEIVRAAQERRYVDANDGYLRLSIGKAAWPIGVTMVGIHERSAREKLHESGKGEAHIMSDEITRKFLQSIKRCLSFAQTRWPPDDQLQLMG